MRHMDVAALKAAARSGAPVRFTKVYREHVAKWMDSARAECARIVVVAVESREAHHSTTRFMSMDNPEELECWTARWHEVRYVVPGKASWSHVDVSDDGFLSDRICYQFAGRADPVPVFERSPRRRRDLDKETFVLVYPCGRHGRIGDSELPNCGDDEEFGTLRLTGTRRGLEQYLERGKKP